MSDIGEKRYPIRVRSPKPAPSFDPAEVTPEPVQVPVAVPVR